MARRESGKQIQIGSIISYAQMGLNIIIGLVYTPVMIRCLGTSEYGLYNTVASTISMLSILSLGFNSSYVRFYSKYKKNGNNQDIFRLNGVFLFVFMIIGSVALICGLYISNHLTLVFADGLTQNEYKIARVLTIILTINLAISFPMSVFQNIISANEKFIVLKVLGMGKTVFGPLITLPLLLAGYRSIAMVLCTSIVSISIDSIYMIYVLVILKNKFVFGNIDRGLLSSLFTYTIFIAINMLIDQINWNVDKMLLGRFKGTGAVAIYSIGYTLYHYYSMFSTSISSLFTPRIHRIVNENQNSETLTAKLTSIFTTVGRVQFIILALIASGLILFGQIFIVIWSGISETDARQAYIVMLLLVIPATVPLIQNLGIEIQRAENKHQFRSIAYAFMALINLGISIYLCQLYGAVGSAVGTSLSLIIANGVVMNIFYHKKCCINIIEFWKSILKLSRGIVIPFIVMKLLTLILPINSIKSLLVGIIFYTLIYSISMWLFGLNENEKAFITKPFVVMIHGLFKR